MKRVEEIAAITEELEGMKNTGMLVTLEVFSFDGRVDAEPIMEKCFVDPLCVYESKWIRTMILEDRSCISYTRIEKKILIMVMEFCKERAAIQCVFQQKGEEFIQEALQFFDSTYLERKLSSASLRDLVHILRAACELKISSLVDLMTAVIVDNVDKKSSRQILKILNLWGKISHNKIKEQMECNSWALVGQHPK